MDLFPGAPARKVVNNVKILRRGKTLAEKYQEGNEPKKKPTPARKLTAAQRKKVDELVRKVTEQNKSTASGKLTGSMEIR